MTNEEIVLSNINTRTKNMRFKFLPPNRVDYFDGRSYEGQLELYNDFIKDLKETPDVKSRVYKIMKYGRTTYYETGRYQCHSGARRSTLDIWKIYKFYFGDIDVFSIMRVLYELVKTDPDLNTYRCPNIRKRVFWFYSGYFKEKDMNVRAELGVPMSEWEHIGENYVQNVL